MNISTMDAAEVGRIRILPDAGFGALRTDRGNLPLDRLDVRARITGLVAHTVVTTEFGSVRGALPEGYGRIVALKVGALAEGMRAFLRGQVSTKPFDAAVYNREATEEFYRAIGA